MIDKICDRLWYIYYSFSWFRQDTHSFADDTKHNLVSPSSYGGQPHIPEYPNMKNFLEGKEESLPVHSADKDIICEPHPSPELQAGVCDLPRQPPCLELQHAGQQRHVLPRYHLVNSLHTYLFYTLYSYKYYF